MQQYTRAAKAAIDARLHKLQMDHGGTREEQQALSDALTGLSVGARDRSAPTTRRRTSTVTWHVVQVQQRDGEACEPKKDRGLAVLVGAVRCHEMGII
jgi:hypothetical protein